MKLNLKRDYTLASLAFGALLLFSCSEDTTLQQIPEDIAAPQNAIIATITSTTPSRTCIDGDPAVTGQAGLLWTPGDALGVFASASSKQVQYIKNNQTDNEREATFVAVPGAEAIASPTYAYYPYNYDNADRSPSDLLGLVPMEQKMTRSNIDGDYKIGTPDPVSSGHFNFSHLFSLVRVAINIEDYPSLEGDIVESATLTVNRGTAPVAITGHFNFDATASTPSYTLASSIATSETMGETGLPANSTANRLVMNWEGNTSTAIEVGYASLFPNVKAGDILTFEVITDRHIASFSVTSKVDFESERLYNFPLTLSNIKDKDGKPVEITVTPRPGTTDPEQIFTFTCATYNVDGLPSLINSDGPGSSGTTTLAQRINSDNKWDFFCVSEDFEYDSQLTAALTNYSHGKYRGTVTAAQMFGTVADTDGLNMFWKNNGEVTVSNETFIEYKDKEGNLYNGANECIKKGFRYYLVTFANGAEVDVYITHMNTFSGSSIDENSNKYVAAVHSQLKQVRDYILANMQVNKRPAIFMGDTNMRYTRHKLCEYFMEYINAMDGYSVVDPWIDLAWNNNFSSVGGSNYPLYGGKSLMVSDATGTNADTDVIISEADGGLQKGEIVDKIFYINCKDAKAQLTAKSYLRDVSYKNSNGKPLADHYPVVVEFEYTTK